MSFITYLDSVITHLIVLDVYIYFVYFMGVLFLIRPIEYLSTTIPPRIFELNVSLRVDDIVRNTTITRRILCTKDFFPFQSIRTVITYNEP